MSAPAPVTESAVSPHVAAEVLPRAGRFPITLLPLASVLLIMLWPFLMFTLHYGGASGAGFGSDFAMFYAGATVVREGGNPFDHNLLLRTETALLQQQNVPRGSSPGYVRVGNPPLFFWALEPLTRLPFRTAGLLWFAALELLTIAGFWMSAVYLGWRRLLVPGLVFLLMPQVFLGPFYGNVISLVFAAIAGALLIQRRHPAAAGALLGVAWLKPPVALPIVLLIVLFHTARWKQMAAGFAAASLCLLGLTLLATGPHSLVLWVNGLVGYSRDIDVQRDIASLGGLYELWAPFTLRIALGLATLAAVAAATILTKLRYRSWPEVPVRSVAWLWLAWFLAAPYAHMSDPILLTVPILAYLGRDAQKAGAPMPALALYLLASCLLVNGLPGFAVNLQCLKLLAAGGILALTTSGRECEPA